MRMCKNKKQGCLVSSRREEGEARARQCTYEPDEQDGDHSGFMGVRPTVTIPASVSGAGRTQKPKRERAERRTPPSWPPRLSMMDIVTQTPTKHPPVAVPTGSRRTQNKINFFFFFFLGFPSRVTRLGRNIPSPFHLQPGHPGVQRDTRQDPFTKVKVGPNTR